MPLRHYLIKFNGHFEFPGVPIRLLELPPGITTPEQVAPVVGK